MKGRGLKKFNHWGCVGFTYFVGMGSEISSRVELSLTPFVNGCVQRARLSCANQCDLLLLLTVL